MAKYFMLECFEPDDWDDSAILKQAPSIPSGESWTGGVRFSRPPEEPLHLEMLESHSDQMLELDNTEALVITRRLLLELREAGVDNLDAYDTEIRHPTTGRVLTDRVAVNVVGLIGAADLERSEASPGLRGNIIDTDFSAVTLDEAKLSGEPLMFRLAENTNALVVHERVKERLISRGFEMLTFVPPEEWMG